MGALSLLCPGLRAEGEGGREGLSLLRRLAHRGRGRGNGGGDTRREEEAERGRPHQWRSLHKGGEGVSEGGHRNGGQGTSLCPLDGRARTNGGGREKKGEGKKAEGGKMNKKNKVCFQ